VSHSQNCAREIHAKVYKLFTYVSDQVNFGVPEHWTSHASSVRSGIPFSDDCDGFALTCAELLLEYNPAIAYCVTKTGEGHLVCILNSWVLDNRYPLPYKLDSRYKWKQFMYMDDKKWVRSLRNGN
jgi:predicted transglutaminase-like cysteine proteinase